LPCRRRPAQYKDLAVRHEQSQSSGLSNEDFLRQSDIRIEIDYGVEPHLDRVIELVNRSNQLNYTKVRIESEHDGEKFLADLKEFEYNAGIVRLWDKYADYGIVGSFMTLATLREYRLVHFVFSCRIMNIGVEQYLYEYLNRPAIDIAGPVATGVRIGFRVDSVDELVPLVSEAGAEVVSGPHDSEWGRRAVVRDLDGHVVELVTPPGRDARPDTTADPVRREDSCPDRESGSGVVRA
jgi:catechol 2,3-dioxygenase-like lactoylglutathione lyase family enzyme